MQAIIRNAENSYKEARNALRFTSMMSVPEKLSWQDQKRKAASKLKTYGYTEKEIQDL